MSEARPCRACGMKIEMRDGPNGKVIPLQRVRTVYVANDDGSVTKASVAGDAIYVSHFETCPKASSFSKPKAEPKS